MTAGISIQPSVCHGKPVTEGTRVLVSTILGALSGGDSMKMIADDYQLTESQILAALDLNVIQTGHREICAD